MAIVNHLARCPRGLAWAQDSLECDDVASEGKTFGIVGVIIQRACWSHEITHHSPVRTQSSVLCMPSRSDVSGLQSRSFCALLLARTLCLRSPVRSS